MGAVNSANKGSLPNPNEPPIFDPMKGFPNGRKERVMPLTTEEMASAHIPSDQRDYCAHKLLELKICARKNFPLTWHCKHERHAYHNCQYEDELLRFKEYERERRLLERQAKKERRAKKLAQQEALGE